MNMRAQEINFVYFEDQWKREVVINVMKKLYPKLLPLRHR